MIRLPQIESVNLYEVLVEIDGVEAIYFFRDFAILYK